MTTGETVVKTTLGRWRGDPQLRRTLLLGCLVAVWLVTIANAEYTTRFYVFGDGIGLDAHAYWLAGRTAHPYAVFPGADGAFLYSPIYWLMFRALAVMPWSLFVGAWMVLEAGIFAWLVKPAGWRWGVPLFLLCVPEIVLGNVYGFFALAIVLGLRRPGWWAVLVLAKLTPGVGALWFAARGQWRAFATAFLVPVAIAAVSYMVTPELWREWVRFLVANQGAADRPGPGIVPRLLLAAALTYAGGRANRPWVLALAVMIAVPLPAQNKDLALLAAIPRLCLGSPRSLLTAVLKEPVRR